MDALAGRGVGGHQQHSGYPARCDLRLETRFRIAIAVNADATINGQQPYVIERGEQVHSIEAARAIAVQPDSVIPELAAEDEEDFVKRRAKTKNWQDGMPLNFVLTSDRFMPTWWTTAPVRAPMLTGWAGGRAADALLAEGGKRKDES